MPKTRKYDQTEEESLNFSAAAMIALIATGACLIAVGFLVRLCTS